MKTLINYITALALKLEGKKTYIVTSLGGLLNLWLIFDPTALTQPQIIKLDAVLVFLGGAALRAGISKA